MMATLTNGSARSGYIPDDASFGKLHLRGAVVAPEAGLRRVGDRERHPRPDRRRAKGGMMRTRLLLPFAPPHLSGFRSRSTSTPGS